MSPAGDGTWSCLLDLGIETPWLAPGDLFPSLFFGHKWHRVHMAVHVFCWLYKSFGQQWATCTWPVNG